MALHSPSNAHDGPAAGLSLCAGYGGLDLGLMLAEPGYRTVGFVEREAHAAAALVARMEDAALDRAPIWDDLTSFDGHAWRGKVDCVIAGYPCQPFSSAGRRGGTSDPRHLWPHVARIIGECGARWAFLENVEGHLSIGFDLVARELQAMGFDVEAGVFSAYEVGAPHWRRRLFILAHADGRGERGRASDRGLCDCDALCGETVSVRDPGGGETVDATGHGGPLIGTTTDDGLPLFAPGPGDLPGWWDIFERRPDLQPEVHGVDDGMADWLDRSRAAGNGVVPLAAALAWRTLKARLKADRTGF